MKEEMKIASSSRFQEIQSQRNALNISSDARNPPLTLCQQKAEHEDIDEAVLAKSQPKLQCNLQCKLRIQGRGAPVRRYLNEEVKTSMLPCWARAPSSVNPTDARGGLLKTALATFS